MEQFLIRDPRFFLPGPADYGLESPNLEIEGIHYASRVSVLNVFLRDFGRSLYLLPLADRRKALLRIRLGQRSVGSALVAQPRGGPHHGTPTGRISGCQGGGNFTLVSDRQRRRDSRPAAARQLQTPGHHRRVDR